MPDYPSNPPPLNPGEAAPEPPSSPDYSSAYYDYPPSPPPDLPAPPPLNPGEYAPPSPPLQPGEYAPYYDPSPPDSTDNTPLRHRKLLRPDHDADDALDASVGDGHLQRSLLAKKPAAGPLNYTPSYVNWVQQGMVTPILNQGNCGEDSVCVCVGGGGGSLYFAGALILAHLHHKRRPLTPIDLTCPESCWAHAATTVLESTYLMQVWDVINLRMK